jgi:hypothetical protein
MEPKVGSTIRFYGDGSHYIIEKMNGTEVIQVRDVESNKVYTRNSGYGGYLVIKPLNKTHELW